jgi:hypothetical protein
VSMCHLTLLKNWCVKSMVKLWLRNQAYLSEDVDKGSRIVRDWKSHVFPWIRRRAVFQDGGEECLFVK